MSRLGRWLRSRRGPAGPVDPGHRQVPVPGAGFSVDEQLAGLVAGLVAAGVGTTCSCQGEPCQANAFVKFVHLDDAVAFARRVSAVSWCQVVAQPPCHQQQDDDWWGRWEWVVEWDPDQTARVVAS